MLDLQGLTQKAGRRLVGLGEGDRVGVLLSAMLFLPMFSPRGTNLVEIRQFLAGIRKSC